MWVTVALQRLKISQESLQHKVLDLPLQLSEKVSPEDDFISKFRKQLSGTIAEVTFAASDTREKEKNADQNSIITSQSQ